MEWSRREFLKALERALAALSLPSADPPPDLPYKTYLPVVSKSGGNAYAVDLGDGVWAVGNDEIEQRIAFSSGGLFTVSLRHKTGGRDWCSLVSSPVFFLREEDADLDAGSGWLVLSSETSGSASEAALRISLQHASRPIRIDAHFHVWDDAPVVRLWTEYENAGAAARRLEAQSFCNLALNPLGALTAIWVAPFSWDWRYTNDSLSAHSSTLTTRNPMRRLVIGPYAAGDKNPNDATEWLSCGWFAVYQQDLPAGLVCGVEWSGACSARLALSEAGEGQVSVEHWRSAFTHVTAPGETVASPVVFVGLFEGSLDEATHLTRTLATRHYVPPRPSIHVPVGAESPYVMADTWGYGPNIDEAGLRAFIDRAAEVGVEGVTIDEGWEQRIGEWVSHPARFPSGLRATIDYVHAKGMAAGLWFALANVDPQSQVALAHPDWLATQGGAPVVGSFETRVLCLSHPEARAWVASQFDRIIGEFDVEWFVQDFETIARCDHPAHAPWHQAGDSEFRNVQALWELIAGVRARHPNLMLENNWSGGRVMDFGMLKLYDTALCDDYNLAARNRLASFGVTHFFPPAFVSQYMGAETDPTLPFDYRTRSHFFGGPWNLMIDLPAQNAAELAGAVSAYKRLRAIIRDGRVYHLKAPSMWGAGAYRHQVDWDAIQAVASGARQAVVLVGRGSGGPDAFNVIPRGLIPDVVYSAESSSGASYASRSGADLMASGIDVSLPERSHETIVLDAN